MSDQEDEAIVHGAADDDGGAWAPVGAAEVEAMNNWAAGVLVDGRTGPADVGTFAHLCMLVAQQHRDVADLAERIEQLESHQRYAAARVGK